MILGSKQSIFEFFGLFLLNELSIIIDSKDTGLYRDDGLIVLRNCNGNQTDKTRKNIIRLFKELGLQIEIQTNLKTVNFLDITLDLNNASYQPYMKPNSEQLYINTSYNHPPNIIKQIPSMINSRISKNSSSKEIFEKSKVKYEEALKNSGYKNINLKYDPEPNPRKTQSKRNIIWFNPPFNKNVSTIIAKTFLQLIKKHFPKSNRLHKIFNKNNVKVSYSCTESVEKIIKSHNKKIDNPRTDNTRPCKT